LPQAADLLVINIDKAERHQYSMFDVDRSMFDVQFDQRRNFEISYKRLTKEGCL
jgi:hypothetical protein